MTNPDLNNNQPIRPPKISVSNTAQVSLLKGQKQKHGTRKALKLTLLAILAVILILGGVVANRAANLSQKIFVGQKMTFFQKIKDVFKGSGTKLVGEDLGQINVLLLGIGGEGHDGPYLSDTMILAQIRPDIGQVSLISIPRDYLVQLPNNLGSRKINAAFAEGYYKNKDWNEAGTWAREAVEKVSGQKIPYFAVVDFAGFEDAVNKVGGVDVNVERDFTDYSYPDSKDGYLPPVTFKKGLEHMGGTRALQFARSRHAAGPEGSDFARSQRQQKIIQAFKDKAMSMQTLSDPSKVNGLLGVFADHFHTNVSPGEIFRIYSLVKEHDIQNFISISLDPTTKLICPQILPENGAYVLTPCPGKTDQDIKNYFANSFSIGKLYQEKSIIWMSTSNQDKAAYQTADQKLKDAGLTVWELPYKGPVLSQNVFYQANIKPATAEFIKNTLGATEVNLPPPGMKIDKSKVDIIVILGGEEQKN